MTLVELMSLVHEHVEANRMDGNSSRPTSHASLPKGSGADLMAVARKAGAVKHG